jgi:hypothetical protein
MSHLQESAADWHLAGIDIARFILGSSVRRSRRDLHTVVEISYKNSSRGKRPGSAGALLNVAMSPRHDVSNEQHVFFASPAQSHWFWSLD